MTSMDIDSRNSHANARRRVECCTTTSNMKPIFLVTTGMCAWNIDDAIMQPQDECTARQEYYLCAQITLNEITKMVWIKFSDCLNLSNRRDFLPHVDSLITHLSNYCKSENALMYGGCKSLLYHLKYHTIPFELSELEMVNFWCLQKTTAVTNFHEISQLNEVCWTFHIKARVTYFMTRTMQKLCRRM